MPGRTKSTWEKGKKPPVQRTKGSPNKKTKTIQAIGLQNWAQLQQWAENDGLQEAIKKMKRLRGAAYINAYTKLLEYVKPKLSRVEYRENPSSGIPFDFEALPVELRMEILKHLRNESLPGEQATKP